MTVIVKIMESGSRLPHSDSRAPFRMISGVHDVHFGRDERGVANIHIQLDRPMTTPGESTEGDSAGTNIHMEVHSSVYVMSEQGKTISHFDGELFAGTVIVNDEPREMGLGPMSGINLFRRLGASTDENASVLRRSESGVWEPIARNEQTYWLRDGDQFSVGIKDTGGKYVPLDDLPFRESPYHVADAIAREAAKPENAAEVAKYGAATPYAGSLDG